MPGHACGRHFVRPVRVPPNPRLQRTRLRAPLSRQPLGRGKVKVWQGVDRWRFCATLVGIVFVLSASHPINPGAVDNEQRTKVASCETAELSDALIRWSRKNEPVSRYLTAHNLGQLSFDTATTVSPEEVRRRIGSKGVAFNTRDPWGSPYQILRNHDKRQPWSWLVRTAGPDGKLCSDSYVPGKSTLGCDDVLRVDGILLMGPECDVAA